MTPQLRAVISGFRKIRRRRDYSAAPTVAMGIASHVPLVLGDLKKTAVCIVPPTITGILSIRKNDEAIALSKKISGLVGEKFLAPHAYEKIPLETLEQLPRYKYFYLNQRGGLVFTNAPCGRKIGEMKLGRKRYPTGSGK